MATLDDNSGGFDVLRWRVGKNEERITKLDDWRRDVDYERASNKEIITQTSKDVVTLTAAFDSLRKTLIQFAFTIAISAIIFALGILAATGKLHT